MALRLDNTAQGTSGATVPTTAIGAPNALDTSTVSGTGSTITFDSAHAHAGTTSIHHHLATVASTAYEDWKASITTSTANAYSRFYLYLTAYPTVTTRIVAMLSGASLNGSLQITTTGTFRTVNSAGSVVATTTGTIPLNTWVRVEFEITGQSGTTATIAARSFSGANLEGATPDTNCSLSNAGTTVVGATGDVRFGHSSSVTMTTAWDTWYDDFAFSDTTQPGASVTGTAASGSGSISLGGQPAAAAGDTSSSGVTIFGGTSTAQAAAATAGAVTLDGTANTANPAPTSSGTVTLSGTATGQAAAAASATGTVTLGGASATARGAAGATGTVTLGGSGQIPTATVRVAVVADMQPGSGANPPPTVVAAKVVAWNPDYVFMPGDLANDGTTAQYGYFDTMYGAGAATNLKSVIRPVPGNHDWGNTAGNSLTAYNTYWGAQADAGDTTHAYSFDIAVGATTWHIIAVDSTNSTNSSLTSNPAPTVGSALYNWIHNDLLANNAKPVIAFWHHPRWSDGTATGAGGTGDDTSLTDLWNLLVDFRADLVFAGHCHSYQRFPQMDKTGATVANGTREIVVGTGGSGLHTLSSTQRSTVNSYQAAAYDNLNSLWFGYGQLTLTPTSYSFKHIAQDGTTVNDSFGPTAINAKTAGSAPTGGITLGGGATPAAPATTVSGGIALAGPPATAGAPSASAVGTLTLGGSATAAARASVVGGTVTLGGTATGTAPASTSGTVTLGGTSSPTAPATAAGTVALGGTATGNPPGNFATGSVTLGGSSTARAASSLTGVITITGGGAPTAPATSAGAVTLGGAVTASLPAGAAGLVTLNGLANATAGLPVRDITLTVGAPTARILRAGPPCARTLTPGPMRARVLTGLLEV